MGKLWAAFPISLRSTCREFQLSWVPCLAPPTKLPRGALPGLLRLGRGLFTRLQACCNTNLPVAPSKARAPALGAASYVLPLRPGSPRRPLSVPQVRSWGQGAGRVRPGGRASPVLPNSA